jgi:hypothetical protein
MSGSSRCPDAPKGGRKKASGGLVVRNGLSVVPRPVVKNLPGVRVTVTVLIAVNASGHHIHAVGILSAQHA